MNASVRIAMVALVAALLASLSRAQTIDELHVGHWVEIKGELQDDGQFEGDALEVLPPGPEEILIGTARRVKLDKQSFTLLGVEVTASERTQWKGLSLGSLEGARIKVSGHFRGGGRLSARQIDPRGSGRDRICGRVDALERAQGALFVTVMGFSVRLTDRIQVENKSAIAEIALAPEVRFAAANERRPDDEDYIPGRVRLSDVLFLGGLFDSKYVSEHNYDVDDNADRDEVNQRLSMRAQLSWIPSDHFRALFSPRYEFEDRRQHGGRQSSTGKPHISEAWVEVFDTAGLGLDLRVGRQDFDDPREWIYKQSLDGARVILRREGLRVELSGSTLLDDGSDRDKHTDNWIAYVSNNDLDRHLAAYVIDRRDDRSPRDYPIHFGARALGHFIPNNKSWLEASVLRGYSQNVDLESYGFDVGTTWWPSFAEPFYFTLGYAFGSGDDSGSTDTDEGFRQTGLQRNNDKLGGVTSFRYYGEVVDPELSNLTIVTLGAGLRLTPKISLDLLYHRFDQVRAQSSLRNTDLNQDPDGIHRSVGDELDLILGVKSWKPWDLEVVTGWFGPGDAFPGGDDTWLAAVQLRYRF